MRTHWISIVLVCGLFTGNGCAQMDATPKVELNGKRYHVEIADNDELRARGLMFRRDLAEDAGMLFIHDTEEPLAYWMKNTYIPLDILYFDSQFKLVSAQLDVPPCGDAAQCPSYPSTGQAMYVLELNAGEAGRLNLKVGDKLRVEGIPALDSPK